MVVQNNKIIHQSSGRVKKTNSHRMEFQAAIEALIYLKKGSRACIYSDSRILIQSVTNKIRRPKVNADQLALIDVLASQHNISWEWVKAHSGITYNDLCDQLCIEARLL